MSEQAPARPKKPAPQLSDYPHRVDDVIRYGDLDPQGHVNNAVFSTYFESGRVAMFRGPDLGIGVPNATFVLVAIFCGAECAAAGRATLVMMDTTTRRPRPLTPEAIAKLEPWRYRGA
jgi:acyl-CoA thioester hydrolase